MPPKKKPINAGQQFFSEVQKAVEDSYKSRPRGMPCLEVLTTEMKRLGLPASDAEYLYDAWLANGFVTGKHRIRSWKAALRNWFRNGWLPSQKGIRPGQPDESYPSYELVQAWCSRKNVSKMTARAWGELMTGRFRGKPITNEVDFDAALEVIRAQWMKEP